MYPSPSNTPIITRLGLPGPNCQIGQIGPIGPKGPIGQIGQIGPIGQIGQIGTKRPNGQIRHFGHNWQNSLLNVYTRFLL